MSNQFYCELCGGLFNLKSQKGNRKMWCDDCKPLAEKLYQAEYYKRRKGEIERLRAALAAKDAEITELKEQHAREIKILREQLEIAVELFEGDDDVQLPGSDANVWIFNARSALANAEPEQKPETCVWTRAEVVGGTGSYKTGCGQYRILNAFSLDGCPCCGKRVEVRG